MRYYDVIFTFDFAKPIKKRNLSQLNNRMPGQTILLPRQKTILFHGQNWMWKDSLSLTRQQAGSLCQSIDVQLNQREALEGLPERCKT